MFKNNQMTKTHTKSGLNFILNNTKTIYSGNNYRIKKSATKLMQNTKHIQTYSNNRKIKINIKSVVKIGQLFGAYFDFFGVFIVPFF